MAEDLEEKIILPVRKHFAQDAVFLLEEARLNSWHIRCIDRCTQYKGTMLYVLWLTLGPKGRRYVSSG